ncbi:MAG TPA: right-handed parallel beta-helix repeat-containing protein [Chitinivibrionales bacterium]|nr:right-handed parallel beta-helix repeat-containing protein [Chitinivibrionales bacterium]
MSILPIFPVLFVLSFFTLAFSAALEVGPGKTYSRIESAYASANSGDTILVYPKAANAAYDSVAVYLTKRKLLIRGVLPGGRVVLDGTGYDYSGVGSVPRAMFQFNQGADSCVVENFEIFGCQNSSYNGAAFRINQVNDITIRNCDIHNNDMGLMSNGTVTDNSAADQLVENCIVHENGNTADPGYNHNFYMGGMSVTIRGCNVYGATTGHDIKSRAHLTIVEGCRVHDCQNREFDLVDDNGVTTVAGSHALLSGCVIVKAQNASGNKTVIHFGQDGGYDHDGTLYVVHCTIVTPYISPVVDLSAPSAGVSFTNTIVTVPSGTQSGQVLVNARNGAVMTNAAGRYMWMSSGFSAPAGGTFDHISIGAAGIVPKFTNAAVGDYSLADSEAGIVDAGLDYASITLPQSLAGRQPVAFQVPLGFFNRIFVGNPDIGAYEWKNGPNGVRNSVRTFKPDYKTFTVGKGVVDARGRMVAGNKYLLNQNRIAAGCLFEKSGKNMIWLKN